MSHGHHHHSPAGSSGRFTIALVLNVAVVLLEGFYGFAGHSMALVSDAAHNLADVLALFLAWGSIRLAAKIPTKTHTYGYRGSTILASLANAIVLLLVTGGILWESTYRFNHPIPIDSSTVTVVAILGIVLNGLTALLFMKDNQKDLNVRSAMLHMIADAAISAGVVVAAVLIGWTGYLWLDPLASILISVFIVVQTWGVLKQAFTLALAGVPEGMDFDAINDFLTECDGVLEVHDLHIWAMSTTEIALTAHLVMTEETDSGFLTRLCEKLHDQFGIEHATLQLETSQDAPDCRQAHPASL